MTDDSKLTPLVCEICKSPNNLYNVVVRKKGCMGLGIVMFDRFCHEHLPEGLLKMSERAGKRTPSAYPVMACTCRSRGAVKILDKECPKHGK